MKKLRDEMECDMLISQRKVLLVFLLLGSVSLFADIVYEGGRSVSGAFLAEIEAPATAAALIGVGEFLGLTFRLFSGYVATVFCSPSILWSSTLLGYLLTSLSIPMIAFAPTWHSVVMLYIVDRLGKGLRTPTRDVILAEVSEGIGVGKGFGIHELLDQVGAFIGPVLVSMLLALYSYKAAYFTLIIPGLISVLLVATAWKLYPSLKSIPSNTRKPQLTFRGYSRLFWTYVAATSILAFGFMHWSIASYYLKTHSIISDVEIGLTYALAMLVDAAVAVPLGAIFDRIRLKTLIAIPLLAPTFIVLVAYAPRGLVYLSAIPWGIVMCSEESIMRASIALLVEPSKRPLAYGVFGLVFGLTWAIGGYIYTALLTEPLYMLIYAFATSTTSLYLYTILAKQSLKI
jgi:MFS family permease